MHRCRQVLNVSLAAGLLLMAGAMFAEELDQEKRSPLSMLVTKGGQVRIVEIQKEGPEGIIEVLDIGSGRRLSIEAAQIKRLKRGIAPGEAVKWTGLPAYLGWALKREQELDTTGQIVRVSPTAVYTNLGLQQGVEVGTKLNVYRTGPMMTDPETGEELGAERSLWARLEVFEVEERFSKARRTSEVEVDLQRGDVVEATNITRAIAILPVTDARGNQNEMTRMVSEQWMTVLAERGVKLVERMKFRRVLAEMELQWTAPLLFDPKTIAQMGKLGGAYAVLTGTVGPAGNGKVRIHARVIKVSTGEVLLSASETVPLPKLKSRRLVRVEPHAIEEGADQLPTSPKYWESFERIHYKWVRRQAVDKADPSGKGVVLHYAGKSGILWAHRAVLEGDFVARAVVQCEHGAAALEIISGLVHGAHRTPGKSVTIPPNRLCTIRISRFQGILEASIDGKEAELIERDARYPSSDNLKGRLAFLVCSKGLLHVHEVELKVVRNSRGRD